MVWTQVLHGEKWERIHSTPSVELTQSCQQCGIRQSVGVVDGGPHIVVLAAVVVVFLSASTVAFLYPMHA
jgi:hypothetical protein